MIYPSLRKFSIPVVAALILLTACATKPPAPPKVEQGNYQSVTPYLSAEIEREMKNAQLVGLSVALVDGGNTVWVQGFGYADKKHKIPVTPDTVFRAASVSKLFTATMAMQLAEQGKLNIDKPRKTYIPEFSMKPRFADAAPVTPRNLMSHYAGLPTNKIGGSYAANPEPIAAVVPYLKTQYPVSPPDTRFQYSNLGFSLLGVAEERAGGKPFAALADEMLLKPLGMRHSYVAAALKNGTNTSKGYVEGKETPDKLLRDIAAGGLNTTAADLARFVQMALSDGHPVLRPATFAEMLRHQNADAPLATEGDSRGLGWSLGTFRNLPAAKHGGTLDTFSSQLTILPQQKIGVVLLTNSSNNEALERIAEKVLEQAVAVKTGTPLPKQNETELPTESEWTAAQKQALTGSYATAVGYLKIFEKGKHLRVQIAGKTLNLIPLSDGTIRIQYKLLGVWPVSMGNLDNVQFSLQRQAGHTLLMAERKGSYRNRIFGEKIEPIHYPAAWQARTGVYRPVNADPMLSKMVTDTRLVEEDGLLLLKSDNGNILPLVPVSDNEAVAQSIRAGETVAFNDALGEMIFGSVRYRRQQE